MRTIILIISTTDTGIYVGTNIRPCNKTKIKHGVTSYTHSKCQQNTNFHMKYVKCLLNLE